MADEHVGGTHRTDGMAQSSARGLMEDQVHLMEQTVRVWCPLFGHLCCDLDDDLSRGPAERLAEAFPDLADIQLHDRPYEVTMPDGSILTIDEGRRSHPGVYLPSAGDGERDVIHCATGGWRDDVHRRRHFTVLHEIGHMVQNRDRTLSRRLRTQRVMDRYRFEERCCDEFAARSLLPDSLVDRYVRWPFDADDVLALYMHSFASRVAVAYRVAKRMPGLGAVSVRKGGKVAKSPMLLRPDIDWPLEAGDRLIVSSSTWFTVRYIDDPSLAAKAKAAEEERSKAR